MHTTIHRIHEIFRATAGLHLASQTNAAAADSLTILKLILNPKTLFTLQLDNLLLHHPANGGPPQLKLCDFGLSKDEAEGAANSSCGTPEYMAPEVN